VNTVSSSRPWVVGLTGGIGSGKSTVARWFASHGIPCIDADDISRSLVAAGTPALQQITDHFGTEVLLPDGNLDRRQLRGLVFANEEERHWLEALLHPRIRAAIAQALDNTRAPWVLLVAPLLLENGLDQLCHRVLVVDIPEDLQVSRTMARDAVEEQAVRSIIASQMPREARLARADDVISNTGTPAQLQSGLEQLRFYYDQQADIAHQES
jgi:dephospho-CoA kinase